MPPKNSGEYLFNVPGDGHHRATYSEFRAGRFIRGGREFERLNFAQRPIVGTERGERPFDGINITLKRTGCALEFEGGKGVPSSRRKSLIDAATDCF